MKMSNAIKNSILIILVILIGHFILKNTLLKEQYKDDTCFIKLNNNNEEIYDKNIRANCDLIQDKKNMFIINEYHDENEMNDGKLSETLNAFDKYDFISV
jgi:hypothetical protein